MEEPQLCVSRATILGTELENCPPQMDSDFNIVQFSDLCEKHIVLHTLHWH